jgi:hypothetical protein
MQQLAFSLHEPIHVEPDPTVLFSGANARRRTTGPLFAHQHVPAHPASVRDDQTWLRMLDLAEDTRRYDQAPDPVLDLSRHDRAGSSGPIGSGNLMLDSNGCEAWGTDPSRASWAQLLAGRREQRHVEPDIAAARDLAEAYHYLDYYGKVYAAPDFLGNDQTVSGSWRADRLITQLARQVLDLGGDPTLLNTHSDYMRAGISATLAEDGR